MKLELNLYVNHYHVLCCSYSQDSAATLNICLYKLYNPRQAHDNICSFVTVVVTAAVIVVFVVRP